MNNKLLQSINAIEKNSCSIKKLKKSRFRTYKTIIHNYLMRIFSFSRFPQYYLPKINISDAIYKARKNIQINFKYSKKTTNYHIEINKVLSRIDLRFKYSQQLLLSTLVKQILNDKKCNLNFANFKWVSLIYPMIHLPNDRAEECSMHTDYLYTGFKGTRIVWLPFTDYEYPGITKKNNFLQLIAHFSPYKLATHIFKNTEEIALKKKHLSGNWMAWNDTFYHRGVLNNSKKTSVALIVYFSNKFDNRTFLPLKYLSTETKGLFLCENQAGHDKLIKNAKLIVKNILKNAKDFTTDKSFYSSINNLLDKDLEEIYSAKEIICIFHIIEYSLNIFARRLENNSIKWLNNEKGQAMDQILKNLYYVKNILIKEKKLLIDKF